MDLDALLKRVNKIATAMSILEDESIEIVEQLDLTHRTNEELERICKYSDGLIRFHCIIEMDNRGMIQH